MDGVNASAGELKITRRIGKTYNSLIKMKKSQYQILIICFSITFIILIHSAYGMKKIEEVTLKEIFVHPEQYENKELSITGYYFIRFEVRTLTDKKGHKLWLENIADNAKLSDIDEVHNSWSRVKGTFVYDRSGHLGAYKGRIENIKKVEPLSGWNEFSPYGFKLKGIIISSKGNKALFVNRFGKAWTLIKGHYFPGLLKKRVKQISVDKVVIIESLENKLGKDTREVNIILKKN